MDDQKCQYKCDNEAVVWGANILGVSQISIWKAILVYTALNFDWLFIDLLPLYPRQK